MRKFKEGYTDKRAIYIDSNFTKEIQPKLDRRIYLIAQSVAGGFLGGNSPNSVSFRHILNRIMLLTQLPLSFIIFKKVPDIEMYTEHYRSNKHPRDVAEVEKFLEPPMFGYPRVLHKEFIQKLFPLFGDDKNPDQEQYALLVILIDKKDDRHTFECLESKYNNDEMKNSIDLTAYVLRGIFKYELYDSYGKEFKKLIYESIKKCVNENVEKPKDIIDESKETQINTIESDEPWEQFKNTTHISDNVLKDVRKQFDRLLLENRSLRFGIKNNGYLDRIYDKSHENIQLISSFIKTKKLEVSEYKKAANYVIYIRDYADDLGQNYRRHPMKEQWNFDGYNYRLRIALCGKQRDDIETHFTEKIEHIKKKFGGLTEDKPNRSYTKLTENLENENIKKLASELDEYFWKELFYGESEVDPDDQKRKSPLERFIKILGAPLSVYARSPVDSVFDGQIYFRKSFPDGGIPRCFPNGDVHCSNIKDVMIFNKEIFNDLLREVICHYWFEGMVSSNEVEPLTETATMYLPVEVGGKIWCVLGYNTQIYTHNAKSKKIDIKSQEVTWYQNYHLFQDVVARKKKDLRMNLLHCYLDLLAHYYEESLKDTAAEDMFKTTIPLDDPYYPYNVWLNERFSALTTVFPYDTVEVKVNEGMGGGCVPVPNVVGMDGKPQTARAHGLGSEDDGIFLSQTHKCVPTLKENQYMPPAPALKKKSLGFVKRVDVISRLSEVAYSKFGEMKIEEQK